MKRRRHVMPTIRRVLRVARKVAPQALLAYLITSAISGATLGGAVYLLRMLISGTFTGALSWHVGVALGGVLLVQQVCSAVSEREAVLLRQKTSTEVNRSIQEILPNVPYSSFEDTAFQAEYGMLVREASFKPASLVDSILQGALGVFTVLAILIALLPIMPVAGLVLLALLVPVMFAERKLRGQMLKVQTYHAPDLLRMQYISQSSIDPDWQRDLRAFGSDILTREYATLSDRYLKGLSAVLTRIQRIRFLAGLSSLVIFGLLFTVVANAVSRHQVDAADAVTLITGGYYLVSRISNVSGNVGSVIESADFMDRVFRFLDSYAAPEDVVSGSVTPMPVIVPKEIRLHSVSYTYPRASSPALNGIDIAIRPGVTAVIGANGAGKSTFVKVLAGMIQPSSGVIEAVDEDGCPILLSRLRVAVMFQHPAQLRLTVRQNVTMESGASSLDADRRVWAVLEDVGLAAVVRALPRGLDSVLGGGFGAEVNLSGGQWQRLVLARTLYRDAQVVILDEPSSHLDAEAEERLLDMLTHGLRERIVVVVTHRRETVGACDRYLELADGAVADSGGVAKAFPVVSHPYLGGAVSQSPDLKDVSSLGGSFLGSSGSLSLVCSFCARPVRVPTGTLSQPDAVICSECAELAIEVLGRGPAQGQLSLDCSFCGNGSDLTIPGPDGVAICAPCAQRWLQGAAR